MIKSFYYQFYRFDANINVISLILNSSFNETFAKPIDIVMEYNVLYLSVSIGSSAY